MCEVIGGEAVVVSSLCRRDRCGGVDGEAALL